MKDRRDYKIEDDIHITHLCTFSLYLPTKMESSPITFAISLCHNSLKGQPAAADEKIEGEKKWRLKKWKEKERKRFGYGTE